MKELVSFLVVEENLSLDELADLQKDLKENESQNL